MMNYWSMCGFIFSEYYQACRKTQYAMTKKIKVRLNMHCQMYIIVSRCATTISVPKLCLQTPHLFVFTLALQGSCPNLITSSLTKKHSPVHFVKLGPLRSSTKKQIATYFCLVYCRLNSGTHKSPTVHRFWILLFHWQIMLTHYYRENLQAPIS